MKLKMNINSISTKLKGYVNRIPEFSDAHFVTASYICGAAMALVTIFFNYEMYTTTDFGLKTEWNIFKSMFFPILFIFGVIMAILNWGKFGHWTTIPIIERTDRYGNVTRERDYDITENMMASFFIPMLGHFFIEPMIYACLVYYPLTCVFALVAAILPYIITLFLIALCVGLFISKKYIISMRYRSLALVAITVIFGTIFTWWGISLESKKNTTKTETEQVIVVDDASYGTEEDI